MTTVVGQGGGLTTTTPGNDSRAAVCDCVRLTHEHGTVRMYSLHRCRCDECREVNAERKRQSDRRRMTNTLTLVNADAARQHVLMLRRSGLTLRDIARRAGVTDRMLSSLLMGYPSRGLPPTERINRVANERLLAIPRPRVSTEASGWRRVSAVGSHRRLRALATMGWSLRAIGREAGIHHQTLYALMSRDMVRLQLAGKIAAAYRDLSMRTPPTPTVQAQSGVTATKMRAEAEGWPGPLDWSPRTIDNVHAVPSSDV